MKVLIVGLPLFAERLAKQLSEFDPDNRYISLNTYYSVLDKIKAYFLIPQVDCVLSINGSLSTSRVFDRAFKCNVPLILHWAGTDVLKSTEAFKSGVYRKDYLENAIHHCSSVWIREELEEIGIHADIIHFNNYDDTFEFEPCSAARFTILTYVSDNRPEFYGMSTIINMAKQYPKIDFVIAGTTGESYLPLPANVQAVGWVSDMEEYFRKAHVCLRYTTHDGFSNFVLESLARHKTVIYRNPLEACIYTKDEQSLSSVLNDLFLEFEEGKDFRNDIGAEFIQRELNKKKVLNTLINKFKMVIRES